MKKNIYLCGGFTSNWQQSVSDKLNERFNIINPRQKEQIRSFLTQEYVAWDLFHVKNCDILLVRLESTNPSGIGLSVEVGYAKALGKTIIGIVDKEWQDANRRRYFEFVVCCFDVIFESKEDAVEYLKTF